MMSQRVLSNSAQRSLRLIPVFGAVLSIAGIANASDKTQPLAAFSDSDFEAVTAKPELPFTPFEMLSPTSGQPLDASQNLSLGFDRVVNAGDYFRALNAQEAYLNKLGVSLRSPEELGTLLRPKNRQTFEKNQTELKKEFSAASGTATNTEISRAFLAAQSSGSANENCNVTPQSSHIEKPLSRFLGDKQFGTYSEGLFVLDGNATAVNSNSSYGAGVQFFQTRTDLYRVNHSIATHVGNEKVRSDTTLYILGTQVFRKSNSGASLTERMGSRLWSKSFDVPGPQIQFNLGPIPMKVESKIRGMVAVDWGVQGKSSSVSCKSVANDGTPVGLGAFIEPSVDATGLVTGGIDTSIGRAGVEGNIQLLNDKITVTGSIAFKPQKGVYLEYISIDNTLDALAGRMVAYAEILVPNSNKGIFSALFKQNRWEKELYSWKGYHAEGNIYRYEPKASDLVL